MWIMIIKKLRTEVSPPKMSIFWAEPWPDDVYAVQQANTCMNCGERIDNDYRMEFNSLGKLKKVKSYTCSCGEPRIITKDDPFFYEIFGTSPNWVGAQRIVYKGQSLRIFPHEFTKLSDERLNWYILGLPDENIPSHELVSELIPEYKEQENSKLLSEILDEAMKPIYDAALLDGATENQAKMLALGMDVSVPDASPIPLLGWYRCRKEFARYYCDDWEMEE